MVTVNILYLSRKYLEIETSGSIRRLFPASLNSSRLCNSIIHHNQLKYRTRCHPRYHHRAVHARSPFFAFYVQTRMLL
jgi:hypothetical protein